MNRIIIFLLSICVAGIAMAQRTYEPKFYMGFHGGATLSRMTFSPSIPQSFKLGNQLGVSVRYSEENNFGLIAELNFVQRGWSEAFDDLEYEYSRTLNYINVPILTHIFFGSQKFKAFFNLGPEVSYFIGESSSANFDATDTSSLIDFPSSHRTEQYDMTVSGKFDYGISVGAGVELVVARKNSIMLEGRFYYGLGNIFPSHKSDYFSASPNMSVSVGVGYMFRVK